MGLTLGIDTGGTYTDASLFDPDTGVVRAGAKALTTRGDLAIGIAGAIEAVLRDAGTAAAENPVEPAQIQLVGLSTTLATNAIVEGQGHPVCLLLLGYDPELIDKYQFHRELATDDVVYVRGGHDGSGSEVTPLDEGALRTAILSRREHVDAFAISGYFGVRNPEHELRAQALVAELTSEPDSGPLPATCGHELSSRLDSIRRATTVALNGRLIPLLHELIITVRRTLSSMQIDAPLMVVKGDGSLVSADWALQRPIETILSGPAASLAGARHLGGREDVWVVDMGGTTTDIAVLEQGLPQLNPEGARVGGWRTMVETVDARTVGLGGDSQVWLNSDGAGNLHAGPKRTVPLCLLAHEHPQVVDQLRLQLRANPASDLAGQLVLPHGRARGAVDGRDRQLLDLLGDSPRTLVWLSENLSYGPLVDRHLRELEARRLVLRSAFTPTDALHVLGRFSRWNTTAARLGAELLGAQVGLTPETFSERVAVRISEQLATALVGKVLEDEAGVASWEKAPVGVALLERALQQTDSNLGCRLSLKRHIVAVGAPAAAYLPEAAAHLGTEIVVPDHAEVANAVGAVVGGVVQRYEVSIRPAPGGEAFLLQLPSGVRSVVSIEEAVEIATGEVPDIVRARAREAGADHVEVRVARQDHSAPIRAGGGQRVFVETVIIFTAVGRPAVA